MRSIIQVSIWLLTVSIAGSFPVCISEANPSKDAAPARSELMQPASSWALVWDKARHVALAVDGDQSIFVLGTCYEETDLDPGEGEYIVAPTGRRSTGYLLKLNRSRELVWARSLEASEWTTPSDVAVDSSGAVYVTGLFKGSLTVDGQTSAVAPELGVNNPCLLKLDASGTVERLYSIEGEQTDVSEGIVVTVDGQDDVYLAGTYMGKPEFEPPSQPYSPAQWREPSNTNNAFLVKMDSSGSVKWARKWAGGWRTAPGAITTDSRGNVYVTGGASPYMGNAWVMEHRGEVDFEVEEGGFLVEFNSYGSTQRIEKIDMGVRGVCFNGAYGWDSIIVAGTRGRPIEEVTPLREGGRNDGIAESTVSTLYIYDFTSRGSSPPWEAHLDGENQSTGGALAVDREGYFYVAGSFWKNADLNPGIDQAPHYGGPYWNHFVIRMDSSMNYKGSFAWSESDRSFTPEAEPCDVAVDGEGNVYAIGPCSQDTTIRLTRDFEWNGELGERSYALFKLSPEAFR